MVRPKANTEAGDRANARWKKTMLEKYGSPEAVHQHMIEMGRKGGKSGRTGGFYGDPERAAKIGSTGGKTSKRGYKFIRRVGNQGEYINRLTGETVRFPL